MMIRRAFLAALLSISLSVAADVAFEASDIEQPASNGSTNTISSFSAGSSANTVIIICAGDWGLGDVITTATYDGNSATSVSGGTAVISEGTFGGDPLEMFYYSSASLPDSGDVVCNYSEAIGYRCTIAIALSGVDTADPIGTAGSSTTETSPSSISITDGASGDMVVDGIFAWPQSLSVGSGQTSREHGTLYSIMCGGSTEPGAGSVTMSWTWSGTQTETAHQAVNINAAAAAGPSAALLRRRRE